MTNNLEPLVIEDYFTDQVTIYTRTVDRARVATDTDTTLNCRVERTDRIVKDQDGEDRAASYQVFLPSSASVSIGDRLLIATLNGTATGDTRKYPVLAVFVAKGFEDGHIEVIV